MGYRRRRHREQDDGLLGDLVEGMVALSKAHPAAGIVFGVMFCVGAGAIRAQGPKAIYGMAGLLAGLCVLFSIPFFLIGIVGIIKNAVGSASSRMSSSLRSRQRQNYYRHPPRPTGPPAVTAAPRPMLSPPSPWAPVAATTVTNDPMPYRREAQLLSKGELAFYEVLRHVAGADYQIMTKVRLLDLLHLPGDAPQRQRWLSLAAQKHVDFVLCAQQNLEPLLVIELDDKSHWQPRRIKRDQLVNDILGAAQVKLLRVRCQAAYDVVDLRESIQSAVAHR